MANISINTTDLGVAWELGTTYRVSLPEGFVVGATDATANKENTSLATFSTPANTPLLQSTYPANGATDSLENFTVSFTLDRGLLNKQTGNIYLYQVGSPDVLVNTWSVTDSAVTLNAGSVLINVTERLAASETYYITTDASVVSDSGGFLFAGVIGTSDFRWTTSANWTADLTVGSPAGTGITDAYYNEDQETTVTGQPQLIETSYYTSSYSLTVTPTVGAVVSISSTGSGGSAVWSAGVYTVSGTGAQVAGHLSTLTFIPTVDYDQSFTLTYELTNPSSEVTSRTQNIIIDVTNEEIFNMAVTRSFYRNNVNTLFASSVPYISETNVDPAASYTITFDFADGGYGYVVTGSEYAYNSSITFTGTASELNAIFPLINYMPAAGWNTNSSFTYTQSRAGTVQINAQSVTLTNLGGDGFVAIYDYDTAGVRSIDLSPINSRYAVKADVLIVGGGGEGTGSSNLSGGGGGGGVNEILDYTLPTQSYSNSSTLTALPSFNKLKAQVGAGGTSSIGNSTAVWLDTGSNTHLGIVTGGRSGNDTVTTSGSTYTRNLSGGASGTIDTNNTNSATGYPGGVQSGSAPYNVNNINHSGGGGGAGAAGGVVTSPNGGAGGAGVLSTLTGYYYGGGGGGAGTLPGAGGAGGGGAGYNGTYNTSAVAGADGYGGGGGGGNSVYGARGGCGRAYIRLRYA